MFLQPSPYPFLASRAGEIGQVTLLGLPLDRTASFRPGSGEGPSGIRWASENLETYSPDLDCDLEDLSLGDLGDLDLSGLSQADAVERIEAEADRLLRAGTLPFFLGGEHTIALPIARAVMRNHPDALIVHLDAHADLRDSYLGEPLSHAAWAWHAGQEFGFDRLVQMGIRSGLREEFRLGRTRSGFFSEGLQVPAEIHAELICHPIYLTVDIDVLDPGIAPGTGTPEAGGASYRELMACLFSLASLQMVAMDINEVAPPLDPTGVTGAVAAKLAREMLLLFGRRG